MSYVDYYRDLKNGDLKSVYALYGPETFILKSMLQLTKKMLLVEGLEELDSITIDGRNLGFKQAKSLIELHPFASKKRLVIIENPDFIDSEKWERSRLDTFLDMHVGADSLLTLLLFDKLDKRKYGAKKLAKIGSVVEFTRIDRQELIKWIAKAFKDKSKLVEKSAAAYLADECGYLDKAAEIDLHYVSTMISTIADSTTNDTVKLNDVSLHLEKSLESNIFKWRDEMILGHEKHASVLLKGLINEEEHPIKLLYMLQAQVRDLYRYSLLKSAGLSLGKAAQVMSKRDFMMKFFVDALKIYDAKKINELLKLCVNADDDLKIGSVDGVLVLQMLAFDIADLLYLTPNKVRIR